MGCSVFYEKPACSFSGNNSTFVDNGIMVAFDIQSTNMCPEVVFSVGLEGQMCNTGKEGYERCTEANGQTSLFVDQQTFFQNDTVYFFIEVESPDARITYSEINEIYKMEGNQFEHLLYSDGLAYPITVTNAYTGLAETVPPIIKETKDSEDFATEFQGVLEPGLFTGFQVHLDPRP
eukprot:UN26304